MRRFLSCKLLAFSFLSLLDFALTVQLLSGNDGGVYESNPVASWFLVRYGWPGLATFKIVLVALVLMLSTMISVYHPGAGRRVLSFACAALVPVVAYSSALAGCRQWCSEQAREVAEQLVARRAALSAEIEETAVYADRVRTLADDLAAGRRRLEEAVEDLQATERARDRRWLQVLRDRYPGKSDAACLAANLVLATLHGEAESPAAQARAILLRAELQTAYAIMLPGQKPAPLARPQHTARPGLDRIGH